MSVENKEAQKQEAQAHGDWHPILAFYAEIMAACVESADVIVAKSKSKLDPTAVSLKLFDQVTTPDYRPILVDSLARIGSVLVPGAFQVEGGVAPQQTPRSGYRGDTDRSGRKRSTGDASLHTTTSVTSVDNKTDGGDSGHN